MQYFLNAIMPVCNQYDINMCVHHDDPPFALLGLPLIVCSKDDVKWKLYSVTDKHNGLKC